MIHVRYFVTIIALLSCAYGYGEKLGSSFNEKALSAHVHTLEEFISRINGENVYPLAPENDSNKVQTTRFSLFDIDLIKQAEDKEMVLTHEKEFVDALEASGVKISMASPQSWIACDFVTEYEGRECHLQLDLTMEEFKPGYWRWAISDVHGLETAGLLGRTTVLPIDPIDHELGFMTMEHFVEIFHDEIVHSKSSRKEIDNLSFFLGLATSGKLKFKYCPRIVFHSLQIPGWEICAERINRIESSNSGWLITAVNKTTNKNQSK